MTTLWGSARLWYSPDPDASANLPTTYKIGAWYATSQFADRRLDNSGGLLLASPTSSGTPLNHTGDWAVYGIIDQMVWQREPRSERSAGRRVRASHG